MPLVTLLIRSRDGRRRHVVRTGLRVARPRGTNPGIDEARLDFLLGGPRVPNGFGVGFGSGFAFVHDFHLYRYTSLAVCHLRDIALVHDLGVDDLVVTGGRARSGPAGGRLLLSPLVEDLGELLGRRHHLLGGHLDPFDVGAS